MVKGELPYPLNGRIPSEEEVAENLEFVNVTAFRKWRTMISYPDEIKIDEVIASLCNLEEEVKELKNREMNRGRG